MLDFELMESRMLLATMTVTNANATGAGSLAQAVTDLNAVTPNPGTTNVIQFNIAASGQQTIPLTLPLDVTQPTTILGYSELGSLVNSNSLTMADNAVLTIILQGSPTATTGLIFEPTAIGSSVQGIDFEAFTTSAIQVGANNVFVGGNFIGLAPEGVPNGGTVNGIGVDLISANGVSIGGTLGGTLDANRNVITGNKGGGVVLAAPAGSNPAPSNNVIQSNFIGTAADGTLVANAAYRNDGGVLINAGTGNTVGGTAAETGNVISGNTNTLGVSGAGVEIQGAASNLIQGDIIGLDPTSLIKVPNAVGVESLNATANTIGGTMAGSGNVISGNVTQGVLIQQTTAGTADGTAVMGNVIGTTPLGTASIGNGSGVSVVGAAAVTIGGTAATAFNIISGNLNHGIDLLNTGAVLIQGDTIGLATPGGVTLPNGLGGVVATNSTPVTLSNSTISGHAGNGFAATSSTGVVLTGDVIEANAGNGVLLTMSNNASITGSTIGGASTLTGNTLAGISVVGSTGATIGGTGAGVMVTTNGADGIDFDTTSTGGHVLSSTITGNTGVGVSFAGTTATALAGEVVTGDMIYSNKAGGLLIVDAPGTMVTSSTIGGTGALGNSLFGVSVTGSANVVLGGAGAGLMVVGNQGPGVAISATSTGAKVLGSTITGNTLAGISVVGSTGATIGGTGAGVMVTTNGADGIDFDTTSTGGHVLSSTITGNTLAGISVVGSTGVIIGGTGAGVMVTTNGADGIDFDTTSTGGQVLGSTITGNTGVGLSFAGTTATALAGEVVTGDMIFSNRAGGLLIVDAPGTMVTSSTIGGTGSLGNGLFGVSVTGSAGTKVLGSTISGNAGNGFSATSSTGVVLSNDLIQSNTLVGVLLTTSSGASISATTIGGGPSSVGNGLAGISVVGSTGVTIGGTASGAGVQVGSNGDDGIDFDETSTGGQVLGSIISGNSGVGVFIAGTAISELSDEVLSGDVIQSNRAGGLQIDDAPGSMVTSSTIGGAGGLGNSSFGVSVTGSANVILGGMGVGLMVLNNQGPGVAISATSPGAQILGSTISNNLAVGLTVSNSNAPTITNVTIANNSGGGILLTNAGGASVNSIAPALISSIANNGGFGVSISGSANVAVGGVTAGVSVINNLGVGIAIDSSNGTNVLNSQVTGNRGDGIDVFGSTLVNIGAGVVSLNLGGGISLAINTTATIGGTVVSSNGTFGVSAINSAITLQDAPVFGNNGVGVSIISPSAPPVLTRETISSNLGGGVLLVNSSLGSVTSSTIGGTTPSLGNTGFGISLQNSPGVVLGGSGASALSILSNAGAGISLDLSNNVMILGTNLVQYNTNGGISVVQSTGVTIQGPIVLSNDGAGIRLANGSNGAIITAATIGGNTGAGVATTSSNGLTLNASTIGLNTGAGVASTSSSNLIIGANLGSGLTIVGNHGVGISVSSGSNITIEGDTIQANGLGGISIDSVKAGLLVTSTTVGGSTDTLGNSVVGISVTNAAGVTLGGGLGAGLFVLHNQGDGIDLNNSPNTQVIGVEVGESKFTGISSVASTVLKLGVPTAGIFVHDNGGDGIDLSTSDRSQISTAIVNGNKGTGISITSPGVTVTGATVLLNTGSGIQVLGSTIPGAPTNPDGLVVGTNVSGNLGFGILITNSAGNTIGATSLGNTIQSNGSTGVEITGIGSAGNVVASDTIVGNTGAGVSIDALARSNIIGGLAAAAGNTISYNIQSGVQVVGVGSSNNVILSNQILFNQSDGVSVVGAVGTQIGNAGSSNVISKNLSDGISIDGSQGNAGSTKILANFIGTDPTGNYGADNGYEGINVNESSGVAIGTDQAGQGNVISDNLNGGIELSNSPFNTLQHNRIGTDPTGGHLVKSTADGQLFGVYLNESASNTIGGTTPDSANIIAGVNDPDDFGIQITGTSASNNVVFNNLIGISANFGTMPYQNYALGDHVGIYINSASHNSIVQNVLGGSDQAEILVEGDDSVGNTITGGNYIDGHFRVIATPNEPVSTATPTGILIIGTQSTIVSGNTVYNVSAGIEVYGTASGVSQPPPVLTTVSSNTVSADDFGVLINGSESNLVVGNILNNNRLAGIEILGTQSSLNTIGGTATGQLNTLTDNQYGIYLEQAPNNLIVGNKVTDSPNNIFTNQAGIYLFGASSQNNAVNNNIVLSQSGYGILFLNTPQAQGVANTFSQNTTNGSSVANFRPNAVFDAPSSGFNLPIPNQIVVPTIMTSPMVSATSVKVQVASPIASRKPASHKVSHHVKAAKTSH